MKKLLILLAIFVQLQVCANMANPVESGTLGGRPFVSQFVDVVQEDLFIKIDSSFEFASFNVKYHISSSKDGIQIPFLFYASEYLDSFLVKIDGREVILKDGSYDFKVPDSIKFRDFSYFFEEPTVGLGSSVLLEESSSLGFFVSIQDMIFFEADILKGEHIIEVNYRASKWIDTWDWVNEYSFRYALSPAKYWKSFGSLNVKIDARGSEKNLTTNLGQARNGKMHSVAEWQFNELPTEILQINYKPAISSTAKFLITIGPEGLAFGIGLLMALVHLLVVVWYRKRNLLKRFSLVVIIGSILIPFFFLICWIYAYGFIDSCVGEHAGRTHGYTFFVVLLYPFILPVYCLVFWLIDWQVKKKCA